MPAPVLAQARQADAVAAGHPRASKIYKLPGVGAPGFPVSIYPPASSKTVNTVGRCPSTSGLRPPGDGTRAVAVAIAVGFERKSFMDDLRASDRAMWPQVLSDWQNGYAPQPTSKVPVLYAGPLAARWPTTLGVPDLVGLVRRCSSALAASSYAVVFGYPQRPGLQGELVFLDRRGRLLLYLTY
jgi:hypothetical protein